MNGGPDDIIKKILKHLVGMGLPGFSIIGMGSSGGPSSNNPDKYVRHVKLSGEAGYGELCMRHTQLKHLEREMLRINNEMSLFQKRYDLAREEFFQDVRKTVPQVNGDGLGGGVGWREWKGDLWVVGWDREEEDDDETPTQEGHHGS